jgi:uncharacterized membrane protein
MTRLLRSNLQESPDSNCLVGCFAVCLLQTDVLTINVAGLYTQGGMRVLETGRSMPNRPAGDDDDNFNINDYNDNDHNDDNDSVFNISDKFDVIVTTTTQSPSPSIISTSQETTTATVDSSTVKSVSSASATATTTVQATPIATGPASVASNNDALIGGILGAIGVTIGITAVAGMIVYQCRKADPNRDPNQKEMVSAASDRFESEYGSLELQAPSPTYGPPPVSSVGTYQSIELKPADEVYGGPPATAGHTFDAH